MQPQLLLALLQDHDESFQQQLLSACELLLLQHQPGERAHAVLLVAVLLRGVHGVRYQGGLRQRALRHFDDDASRAIQQAVLQLTLCEFQQGRTATRPQQALLRFSDDEYQPQGEQQSPLQDVARYRLRVASGIVHAHASRRLEHQGLCGAALGVLI